jgi:hypothetical protein
LHYCTCTCPEEKKKIIPRNRGTSMAEEYEGFCTLCGEKIRSFEGLEKCPHCGTKGVPCGYENQVNVSINMHELRVLCIWAENWGQTKSDDPNLSPDVVYAIARRLRRQLGDKDTSLTMADEFRQLKDSGYEFETDHPSAERVE